MSEAGLDTAVRALVERALTAIDDDAPDYGEPLRALAQPALLARLRQERELGRALFAALRKLRPVPLWVRDRAELALAHKRDFSLDGAVCTLPAGATLPTAEGRECWLEVSAPCAADALRVLPSGWGLIVTGDLTQLSFARLRRLSPLRALGITLDDRSHATGAIDARLDLVIARAAPPAEAEGGQGTHVRGARMLRSVESPEQLQLAAPGAPSTGLLCDGDDALLYALRLATVRLATVPPR